MKGAANILRAGFGLIALIGMQFYGGKASLTASTAPKAVLAQKGESADQLVRDAIWNELQAQVRDLSLWRYRETKEEGGKTEVLDVVQTKDGEIDRIRSINGEPLNAKQKDMEDRRIQKLLADPERLGEEAKKRHEDAEQERNLLKMLPNAFHYAYEGQEGGLIKLKFTPNPDFRPTSRQGEVFHHMEGHMLISASQKRLAGLDGRLMSGVKFWGGMLGHLDKGGTFAVTQKDVGSRHWEMTALDVQMDGKALFFKTIAVRQKESYTDFRPVSQGMTLQEAAQVLR